MLTIELGRTGLRVSRMGLGGGGHSGLGLRRGGSTEEAIKVVRTAIDLGVNFNDTAEAYGTEEAIGIAIAEIRRDEVVLSTKVGVSYEGRPATAQEIREHVEGCLQRLRTDYVDILHLHGVLLAEYPHAHDILYPELAVLRAEGKIRHIGITEAFIRDPGHAMLGPAVQGGPWEVVMVGFSLLNPSARERVLPFTKKRGIGTLCMFAVRRALSDRNALIALMAELVENGHAELSPLKEQALDFLASNGVASTLQEAAYRFCLWEPGIDIVLSGTGNVDHLRENARALQGPPLPEEALNRLRDLFGQVDSVSGN